MQSQLGSARGAGEWRRARRRLRFVDADNAAKVLGHDRYWTAAFWQLYVEECRLLRLRDPRAARALAVHAPELAARIRRLGQGAAEDSAGRRSVLFRSAAEGDSAAVRSWALVAECERLCGALGASRRALERARGAPASGAKISLTAVSELRRASALYELAAGRRRRAYEEIEQLAGACREVLGEAEEIADETSLQYAETLLVLGSAAHWLESADGGATVPERRDQDLAVLAQCAAFARPRQPLGEAIFDAALELLDRRLGGPRPAPAVLEASGSWLRRARRQPFKRGERTRRMRLIWTEGRVLSLLGISRLAQRRLRRARDILRDIPREELDPPRSAFVTALSIALVTLDLVMLDVGSEDRGTAARRLEDVRQELARRGLDPELDELLRQARRASFDSLLVFRRRLARRLEWEPPAALVPRPPSRPAAAYSTPSLGGVR